jgi:hypothetical protein
MVSATSLSSHTFFFLIPFQCTLGIEPYVALFHLQIIITVSFMLWMWSSGKNVVCVLPRQLGEPLMCCAGNWVAGVVGVNGVETVATRCASKAVSGGNWGWTMQVNRCGLWGDIVCLCPVICVLVICLPSASPASWVLHPSSFLPSIPPLYMPSPTSCSYWASAPALCMLGIGLVCWSCGLGLVLMHLWSLLASVPIVYWIFPLPLCN